MIASWRHFATVGVSLALNPLASAKKRVFVVWLNGGSLRTARFCSRLTAGVTVEWILYRHFRKCPLAEGLSAKLHAFCSTVNPDN